MKVSARRSCLSTHSQDVRKSELTIFGRKRILGLEFSMNKKVLVRGKKHQGGVCGWSRKVVEMRPEKRCRSAHNGTCRQRGDLLRKHRSASRPSSPLSNQRDGKASCRHRGTIWLAWATLELQCWVQMIGVLGVSSFSQWGDTVMGQQNRGDIKTRPGGEDAAE